MSFIDTYLKNYKLDDISNSAKSSLDNVEKDLQKFFDEKSTDIDTSFDTCVKQFGPQIADLISRFSSQFAKINGWSLSTIAERLRFVINIGTEVYQIVNNMQSFIIVPTMTDAEKHTTKVEFGKRLVYFVWKTVDPLKNIWTWLPFKQTIEKKLVFWLAGMALDHTVDLLSVKGFSLMGEGEGKEIFKAIP